MGEPSDVREIARRRKIVFLTGTRADFGKIKSLVRTLREAPPEFDVHLFATGMHMEPKYGYTVTEIEKSGFDNIYRYINRASHGRMDRCLASTVEGFADYVRLIEPDMIVVHGDRVEALAGALVGALNNVLVAHIEGGEVSGTIDELIRHSVSKMSHLHFVSNDEAKRRLVQLGEEPRAIFVIGSPDVDIMSSPDLPALDEIKDYYEIPFDRYGILVWHPVTTLTPGTLARETREVVESALDGERNWVVVYPNNDHGSDIILEQYATAFDGREHVRVFPSIRFEAMLVLLKNADLIVGNSSMGIREAPYYGVPTVNVGLRQDGRSDNPYILDVPAARQQIIPAIRVAVTAGRRVHPVREFGVGDSHERFRHELERPDLWDTPVQKRFRDLPELVSSIPPALDEPDFGEEAA